MRLSDGILLCSFLNVSNRCSGVETVRLGSKDVEFLALGVVHIIPRKLFDAAVYSFSDWLKLAFFFGDLDRTLWCFTGELFCWSNPGMIVGKYLKGMIAGNAGCGSDVNKRGLVMAFLSRAKNGGQ